MRWDSAQSSEIWALAARQHGVVARSQLLARGVSPRTIERSLASRRLHRALRGVYALGRPELTREGRWMAIVLACGPGAVLSHGSAAALLGIGAERGIVEVSVVAPRAPRPPRSIRVHRRARLSGGDVVVHRGLPVTAAARTLVDLASYLPRLALEAAVNEADKRGLIDPEALRGALTGYAGQPGVAPLRALLDRATFVLTDSELERRFGPIARRAGLPAPLTGRRVHGFRVDFLWPALRLVVETDGLRYHRTPTQQARDRRRDQELTAGGLTVLRFTHAQVRLETARRREDPRHGRPPAPRGPARVAPPGHAARLTRDRRRLREGPPAPGRITSRGR